jgi:hypothetical protein
MQLFLNNRNPDVVQQAAAALEVSAATDRLGNHSISDNEV